ncbi:hypothetical protein SAE02_67660 [Skermanella aerolata]|uniref:Uncharacterized protein n=1 Tax=Skermanella aerolata TaxID=393310 RepID=A0A512E1M6_9PROT|nr:hypothetical protein [Skermanella aerolata]GEO42618.1 hypothetical protein SAE02_67660 [Skermanella aerolata]
MPRKRDPSVFTTSVSGIPEEIWTLFKEQVARYKKTVDSKYTFRKALEGAVEDLWSKFCNPEKDFLWAFPSYGKPVPIQMSDKTRSILQDFCAKTGYKQNVVIMSSICLSINKTNLIVNAEQHSLLQNSGLSEDELSAESIKIDDEKDKYFDRLTELVKGKTAHATSAAYNGGEAGSYKRTA